MITRSGKMALVVALGDVIAFLLFTVAGRLEHQINPFAPHFFETALPFALAWLLLATALGVFRSDILKQPRAMVGRVTVAWTVACPIGLFVRAQILDRTVSYLFGAVTFGMMWVILVLWRLVWLAVAKARGRHNVGHSSL